MVMEQKKYIETYLKDSMDIINRLDREQIMKMSAILKEIQTRQGRLFILGVGGGAGNASHAVNDFRKIAGIESYTPADNISELTARINDDGWETVFTNWLTGSRLNSKDGVLVFSVGGGNVEKKVSVNIVKALQYAKEKGASIMGIVGRDGGYTAKVADACIIIPTVNNENITPQTEAFQAVIWHLLVSSPEMKKFEMKWESTK
jgi:D-sedoheptulose 7-phosphate isomerase